MSFEVNNPILASDFIELKARVKAECARRRYNGSVAQYATSTYDYTVQPTIGGVPLPQHLNKIIVPLNAIRNTGISETRVGYLVRTYDVAETIISELEAIEADAENSGCSASCTGLCQGTCASGCTSCTGTSSGVCNNCNNSCSSTCGNNCKRGCSDCSTGCGTSCSKNCNNSCSGGCTGGCTGSCQGWCLGGAQHDPQ